MTVHNHSRIAPFGHLRVKGHLHLTAAFRSLSRPSSADIAKASTVCSYYLNLCKIHTLTFLASQDASASFCLKDSPSVRQKTFRVKYFFRFLLLYSFQRTDLPLRQIRERMILSKLSSTLNNRCPTSPPACKAGALPAELHPHIGFIFFLGFLIQLMNADPFR